jgi:hypothetical protein
MTHPELIRLEIEKKALVIGFIHPFNAIKMMADSIGAALALNGYKVTIATIGEEGFNREIEVINDKKLELIFCLGSIPLDLLLNGKRLWDFVGTNVQIIELVLDSLPYDFRILGFSDFVRDYSSRKNLSMASFEGNIANMLSSKTGKTVHHMYPGFYAVPLIGRPKKFPDRLFFWGSVETELGITEVTNSLRDAISRFNVWELSNPKIDEVVACVEQTTDFYSFTDFSKSIGIEITDLLRPEWIDALCAIDSAIKRYRRVFLINAIQDLPIDLYGKNWNKYIKADSNMRVMQFEPDDNRSFSYICQEYAGLINIDPNWSDGTNERAVTALALGINVASNRNKMLENLDGFYQYDLSRGSIREACALALKSPCAYKYYGQFSWETVITRLMVSIKCASYL